MRPPPITPGTGRRQGPAGRIRVLVAAEVRFYREGLARVFTAEPGFEVSGTAADPGTALECARNVAIDVVLLDITVDSACHAARMLAAAAPDSTLVALGVHDDEREVIALAEAGVAGFVARDASLAQLCQAVRSAATGETLCSPRVAAILAQRVSSLAQQVQGPSELPLTRRQLEIVRLIGEGLPNKAIAQQLFIEVATVKNHVHNILERLGVQRREDAVSVVRSLSAGA